MRRRTHACTCALLSSSVFAMGCASTHERTMILWAAQWNTDGSEFAVGGEQTLWIYDAQSLKRRSLQIEHDARTEHESGSIATITHVDWHPTRDLLATSNQGPGVCAIYELESHDRVVLSPQEGNIGRGVDWNPEGDTLAISSSGDGHLRIYDIEGNPLPVLHQLPSSELSFPALAGPDVEDQWLEAYHETGGTAISADLRRSLAAKAVHLACLQLERTAPGHVEERRIAVPRPELQRRSDGIGHGIGNSSRRKSVCYLAEHSV